MRLVRVFIVSEVQLYLAAIESVLATQGDVEVVAAASSLHEARSRLLHVEVDVVLLDLMPTDRHLRALRTMVRTSSGVDFVAVGRQPAEDEALAWLEAGAAAVVERAASIADLHTILVEVHRNRLRSST
jgi:DNA-binding NarL/FixJ family response regulator